tara:strand:- start:876 stop:1463 length:588 start_codon:yes stop_codon:yes gene_type:complete
MQVKMNIVLASSSKHRKKLLQQLKVKFKTISPNIDETRLKGEDTSRYVRRLSIEKALRIAHDCKESIVIGSDEVAVVGNKILGKPLTRAKAIKQLKMISGKEVIFKTGLCVVNSETFVKYTTVVNYKIQVKKLSQQEIKSYLLKEDVLSCAGSIKLEGLAIAIVTKATGNDPTSVIGLPLIKLREFLEKHGVYIL